MCIRDRYDQLPTARLGTLHHICLEVPDIDKAKADLESRPARKNYTRPMDIATGTNRKRQMNLYDPDGTRSEVMEPNTVDGKPAPPSSAPPPRKLMLAPVAELLVIVADCCKEIAVVAVSAMGWSAVVNAVPATFRLIVGAVSARDPRPVPVSVPPTVTTPLAPLDWRTTGLVNAEVLVAAVRVAVPVVKPMVMRLNPG